MEFRVFPFCASSAPPREDHVVPVRESDQVLIGSADTVKRNPSILWPGITQGTVIVRPGHMEAGNSDAVEGVVYIGLLSLPKRRTHHNCRFDSWVGIGLFLALMCNNTPPAIAKVVNAPNECPAIPK